MKYRDLQILTQREAPNNARTEGFAFLARAGYVTRENSLTPLGEFAVKHLREIANSISFKTILSLLSINNDAEIYFPISTGAMKVIHCPSCKYSERHELARFAKQPFSAEEILPMEKILTPDCNTIEALANFMGVPKEKTAKALMFTRLSDRKFIFVVVRGDMQMSEAKLKKLVGDFRQANAEEIIGAGAVAGFASAIGLRKDALIVVDDLIPQSPNLVAGANEAGCHLKNTNYGRDYSAEIVADIVIANTGDSCPQCGSSLELLDANLLRDESKYYFENILLALAEVFHDEKGLMFPKSAAPFDVYLMHIPGKEMDTLAKAEEIYNELQAAEISVLFDDRNERPGIKFNDADLIGCPWRVTVGEKNLKDGMVELKSRTAKANQAISISEIISFLNQGNS
jgi:prolyl-tRNA synthetase